MLGSKVINPRGWKEGEEEEETEEEEGIMQLMGSARVKQRSNCYRNARLCLRYHI